MIRRATLLVGVALAALLLAAPAQAAEAPCELTPRAKCFGLESLDASLSTTQAGAHPDLNFTFIVKQDPESPPNAFGLRDSYAQPRSVRFELPPGLIGDPNVIGATQQCAIAELLKKSCPNGSQVGLASIFAYQLKDTFLEPVYMMRPPGGDVVARLGVIAGTFPVYIDARVRSEGDYGITLEFTDITTEATLIISKATTWGVPADPSHNTERCTPLEAFAGCKVSVSRPPGSRPLPFLTNPTRCGVPLKMTVGAASWVEPQRFDTQSTFLPEITGCNRLPFGPSLTVEPTSHRAGASSGLGVTIRLPASEGVDVLEPSQMRAVRIAFPPGLALNSSSADGLATCSSQEVGFEKSEASHCPEAAKLADAEFEVPVLERRLKGAIYLREPEPGDPVRIWIVADDLGLHIKIPGRVHLDPVSGQVESIVLGTPRTEGIPQAPLREVKLNLKSGFRAPIVNPPACGTYFTEYEFVPWSGGSPVKGSTPMKIDEGCSGLGTFQPKLSAGSTDPTAGRHSPFVLTLTREDGEQNPVGLDFSLPVGFSATFTGVGRCLGAAAETGACPSDSRIGKVNAAIGVGPAPLWVPQPGKRPTAVYLSGPYKGAPLSVVAVVPRQAGPFDFGDEVVRSAIQVDPVTARATVKTDPLPQIIEGIPIRYRTVHIELDRPNFALNPTSCAEKATEATLTSTTGAIANLRSPFEATNCAKLTFGPKLAIRLKGGIHRGAHPRLTATLRMPKGGANLRSASVALPHSEFIDQAHFKTICTRVQFAAKQCPAGSIYGSATATTPLLDEPLTGDVYLRSSSHKLPDLVVVLHGPPSLPIEIDAVGRIDSVNGGIRTTFETIPDAPVSEFTLRMQGGAKGVIVNSTNICKGTHRATAKFAGQNGRRTTLHPPLKPAC